MLSTLSTADVLVKSDATTFRTEETLRVWSTPIPELDFEKKLAVQVVGYLITTSSNAEHTSSVDAPGFSIPWQRLLLC